jgi:hypothetical protein
MPAALAARAIKVGGFSAAMDLLSGGTG